MNKNMKEIYEDLIQLGLLRMKNGKLSLKRPKPELKEMVKQDPRFDSFRNNSAEFKYVAQAGKLLREALQPINFPIPNAHRRLHSLLQKIVKTDVTNKKGSRSIMKGDIDLLKGFSFNEHSCLHLLLKSKFLSVIHPRKGKAVLFLPFLDPDRDFKWPDTAEAIEIDSMMVSINFDTEAVEESRATSQKIVRNQKAVPPFQLITEVSETENRILLHVVALRFYFKSGANYLQSNNRNFNPVEIYNVERGK
jgi:hypothetical protein